MERRMEILRAIVEDYVATNEPVGSKVLAARHGLSISPATNRNEMAALEDEGLIIKPKANSVLIFPSSFVHGVLPVVSGNRYMTQTYAYRHPLSHYDAQ